MPNVREFLILSSFQQTLEHDEVKGRMQNYFYGGEEEGGGA